MGTQFYQFIFFLLIAITSIATGQQTFTWKGGIGDWNNSANWTPAGIPGASDTALVTGDVTLGSSISLGGLTLDNGSIAGDYDIAISGIMNWIDGTVSGAADLQIASGAILSLSGSAAKQLDGRTLENIGSIIWKDSGTFRIENNAVINNQSGGIFESQSDAVMDFFGVLGGTLTNSGLFKKTAGNGNTTIDLNCTSSGTVEATSGTIKFTRGGLYSGTFSPDSGAIIRFQGENQFLNGALLNGNGILQLASDSLWVLGGGFTSNANSNFLITGGILTGSGATLIDGNFSWTGGTITGTGSFAINGSYSFSGNDDKNLKFRTLSMNAPGVWSGDGDIKISENATLQVTSDTLDIQTDADIRFTNPGGGFMFNTGTVLKSLDDGTCTISVDFLNTGAVHVAAGEILLNNNTSSATANYYCYNGASLRFEDFAHTFNSVVFDSSGSISFDKAEATLSGSGLIIKSPMTVNLDGSGMEINGSSDLVLEGKLNWLRGTISGSGDFINNGVVELSSSRSRTLSERTLTNNNTINWTGTGSLRMSNGAILQNAIGSVFDFQVDAMIDSLAPGGGTFNNLGILQKTSGVTTSGIDVPLNNSGTVIVNSGTLELTRGGAADNGVYTIGIGAVLEFDGGSHGLNNITLNNNGKLLLSSNDLEFTGGDVSVGSAGIMQVDSGSLVGTSGVIINGQFVWNGGNIALEDTLHLQDSTVFSSTMVKNLIGSVIENNGVIFWDGSGDINISDEAILHNRSNAIFETQATGELSYQSPSNGSFVNDGNFLKTDSLVDMDINVKFTNNNLMDIREGMVDFSDTLSNTNSGVIQGNGTLRVTNATFLNNGTIAPGLSPGLLKGRGTFSFASDATLSIEIGGATAGVGYDRLALAQDAELGGTLDVKLINDFVPAVGDTFRIMTFSSRVGNFQTFNSPEIFSTQVFNVSYEAGYILLTTQTLPEFVSVDTKIWLEGAIDGDSMYTDLDEMSLLPLAQPFNTAPWYYNGGENVSDIPDAVVDWILLELRSEADSTASVVQRAGFLLKDGTVRDVSGISKFNILLNIGNYYLVVHHHNHLSIMSASAISMDATSALYDFTTAQTQAFGTNPMKEISTGKFALYAGESNGDGTVDAQDKNNFWRLQNGTVWQYSKYGDFNLDGGVDVLDLNDFWRGNNGASTQVPIAVDSPLIPMKNNLSTPGS